MNREFDASVRGRIVATVDSILVIESKNSEAILNKNSTAIQKPNFQVYLKDKKIGEIYDIIGNTKIPYFLAKAVRDNSENREKFIKDLIHKEISIRFLNKPKNYKK